MKNNNRECLQQRLQYKIGTGTNQIWAREEGKHETQRDKVWHYSPLPNGASRAVHHPMGSGGGQGTGGRITGLQSGAHSGSHGGSGDSGGHGEAGSSGGHGGAGSSGGHGGAGSSGGHGGSGSLGGHGGSGSLGGHGGTASETASPAPASVSSAGALLPPQNISLGKTGATSGTWGHTGGADSWGRSGSVDSWGRSGSTDSWGCSGSADTWGRTGSMDLPSSLQAGLPYSWEPWPAGLGEPRTAATISREQRVWGSRGRRRRSPANGGSGGAADGGDDFPRTAGLGEPQTAATTFRERRAWMSRRLPISDGVLSSVTVRLLKEVRKPGYNKHIFNHEEQRQRMSSTKVTI